jgi:hypothetical protein
MYASLCTQAYVRKLMQNDIKIIYYEFIYYEFI